MFKYTRTTLNKLEDLFKDIDYKVRYEKGNFQSGYCIVENKKIVVINKFFDIEARINCLIEIFSNLEMDSSQLSEESIAFYAKVLKYLEKNLAEAETQE